MIKNDSKEISCYMHGGMGNQIFQHVLLFWLEETLGKNIVINKSDYYFYKKFYYKTIRKSNPSRLFNWLIGSQKIRGDLQIINRLKSLFNNRYRYIFKKIITNKFFNDNLNSDEKIFLREISKCQFLNSHCVFPQLLNFSSFRPYWKKIGTLCESSIKKKGSSNSTEKFDFVIHIRKGDYLEGPNKKLFAVLSKNYYINAINYLFETKLIQGKPECLVIGNDIKWAKSFLNADLLNIHYKFENELDDFYSIATAKNLVIANSSFSYSAAMVSMVSQENTCIICPENYYFDNLKYPILRHKNWIVIKN